MDRRLGSGRVLDLNAACTHYLGEVKGRYRPVELASAMMPGDMLGFLDGGPDTLGLAGELVEHYGRSPGGGTAADVKDKLGRPIGYDVAAVRLRAPLPRPRGMGIGYFNTRGIIEEASRAEKKAQPDEGIKMAVDYPRQATVSWANISSVIGPDDPIVFPKIVKQLFNSIELGLVIGRYGYRVSKSEAESCVVGYTVTTDITAFDLVQKENFVYTVTRCKSMPTFWPTGPWIALKDEVGDPMRLAYEVRVNGKRVMNGSTSEYVFSPVDYVVDVSEYMTLEPGMIIGMGAFVETTNTFLEVGDVVENEIERVGVLRNHVVAET
jgi:acylpyruvate hydrolase